MASISLVDLDHDSLHSVSLFLTLGDMRNMAQTCKKMHAEIGSVVTELNRNVSEAKALLCKGTSDEFERGFQLMQHCAARKHPRAIYYKAYWHMNPVCGSQYDHDEAEKLFLESASAGDKLAKARCLQEGWDCVLNNQEAFELLNTLDKEDPRVITSLGFCYDTGTGTEKNSQKAVELYEQGMKSFDIAAIHNRAVQYEAARDYTNALRLYEQGAALGSAQCMTGASIIYLRKEDDTRNLAKARDHLQRAINTQLPRALELFERRLPAEEKP